MIFNVRENELEGELSKRVPLPIGRAIQIARNVKDMYGTQLNEEEREAIRLLREICRSSAIDQVVIPLLDCQSALKSSGNKVLHYLCDTQEISSTYPIYIYFQALLVGNIILPKIEGKDEEKYKRELKLATCTFLREAVALLVNQLDLYERLKKSSQGSDSGARNRWNSLIRAKRLGAIIIPSLLECMQNDAKREGRIRTPTRLTVEAADVTILLIEVQCKICSLKRPENLQESVQEFLANSKYTKSLLRELVHWYKQSRPLFIAGINEISRNIDVLDTIIDSVTKSNPVIFDMVFPETQINQIELQKTQLPTKESDLINDSLTSAELLESELCEKRLPLIVKNNDKGAQPQKRKPLIVEVEESEVDTIEENCHESNAQLEASKKLFLDVLMSFSKMWLEYSAIIMEQNKEIKKRAMRLISENVKVLKELNKSPIGEVDATDLIKHSLLSLCLLFGKIPRKDFELIVKKFGMSDLYQGILQQLRSRNNLVHVLAVPLLSRLISMQNDTDLEMMTDQVFHLLEEETSSKDVNHGGFDGTSTAIVAFCAELISRQPFQRITWVFDKLKSQKSRDKVIALSLLKELYRISGVISDVGNDYCHHSFSCSELQIENIKRTVASNLLEILDNEDLSIRTDAAKLFSNIQPSFIFPRLCELVYDNDPRKRSAAMTALVSAIEGHKDPCSMVITLIDCLREKENHEQKPQSSASSPSDLLNANTHAAEQHKESNVHKDLCERVFVATKAWAENLADSIWDDLIPLCWNKFYSEPSDRIMVRFLTSISGSMSRHSSFLFSLLLQVCLTQDGLTEELLNEKSKNAGEKLKQMLFQRLAPLLILRPLSLSAFESKDKSATSLADELFKRMCDTYEFQEVKRLSAEIFSRFPIELSIIRLSDKILTCYKTDYFVCKICIFSMVNLVFNWKTKIFEHPFIIKQIMEVLIEILNIPCSIPDQTDEKAELEKLQYGCIDCLAIVLYTSCKCYVRPSNAVQESEYQDPAWYNFDQLSQFFINYAFDPKTGSEPARICVINVFISACKNIETTNGATFVLIILPKLLKEMKTRKVGECGGYDRIYAACVQFLFSLVYRLRELNMDNILELDDIFGVSVEALKNKNQNIRFVGLKLFAALLGCNEGKSISELAMHLPLVESIANLDENAESRKLAHTICKLIPK